MTGDEPPRARSRGRTRRTAPVAIDPGDPTVNDRATRLDQGEPQPIPEDVLPSSPGMTRASYGPTAETAASGDRDRDAPARPPNRVRRATPPTTRAPTQSLNSSTPTDPPDAIDSPDDVPSTSSPPPRRPTWRELSLSPNKVPLDEALRRTSVDDQPGNRQVVPLASAGAGRETTFSRLRLLPRSQSKAATTVGQSVCRMDEIDRRVVDFQLPSLDGNMVSFHDIDADVILLDFWGSWCRECRTSISHLRELQSQLGGKHLQVIGVACEKGATFEERRAKAAGAVKRLGINYPVLLSSMDGSCPLQQAFQVQFYPTMVLLDRDGRILHTERGATDATLGRTDRSIATALRAQADRSYE